MSHEVLVESQTISPGPCDAWDAWFKHCNQLRRMLARFWERCSVQA